MFQKINYFANKTRTLRRRPENKRKKRRCRLSLVRPLKQAKRKYQTNRDSVPVNKTDQKAWYVNAVIPFNLGTETNIYSEASVIVVQQQSAFVETRTLPIYFHQTIFNPTKLISHPHPNSSLFTSFTNSLTQYENDKMLTIDYFFSYFYWYMSTTILWLGTVFSHMQCQWQDYCNSDCG